jgi:hypothetical protein
MQLCGAAQNPADKKTLRCVLNQGHEGPHEGFDSAGNRVKFEVAAPKKP